MDDSKGLVAVFSAVSSVQPVTYFKKPFNTKEFLGFRFLKITVKVLRIQSVWKGVASKRRSKVAGSASPILRNHDVPFVGLFT